MDEEFNLWQKLVLGATKPFRVGANVLGQYYGSALTGEDMTQQNNQGKFLQWLSSALTPEEQTQIEEKPYLNAIKSSAGMASTLMPFTKAGVVGNVGSKMANPTLSKFTNLLSRGGLEGGVGGFGYSREGKELQDTLLGMGLGAGGEVLGGLISDPTFRRGMGQEIMKGGVTPEGRYTAFAKLGDDVADDADNVIDLTKDKLYLEARKYDTPEEFIKAQVDPLYEYNRKDLNIFKDPDIGRGTVKDAINDIGGIKNVERGFVDVSQIEPGENININAERAQRALQEIKGGLRVPIIAEPLENGKFLIQDGNNRYIAYKSLGIKEIPIIAPKGSGLKQPKTEDLLDIWNQAHSTVEDLTKPMEERLLDSRTIGEVVRDDTMKLRNIGKDGQTIFRVTRDNSPKSTRPASKQNYSDLIRAAKKKARNSKIPIRSSAKDLIEEMKKTNRKWGLNR